MLTQSNGGRSETSADVGLWGAEADHVGGALDFDEMLSASGTEIVAAVIACLALGAAYPFYSSSVHLMHVDVGAAVAIGVFLASGLLYSLLTRGGQRVTVSGGRVTLSQRGERQSVQFSVTEVVDAYLARWGYRPGFVSIWPADGSRRYTRAQPTMNWLFATLLGVARASKVRNGVVVHVAGQARPYLIVSAHAERLLSALGSQASIAGSVGWEVGRTNLNSD